MLQDQEGKCYICRGTSLAKKRPTLRVDHNHITGKVRKLLCNSCNIIAGAIENSKYPAILKYLKEHDENDRYEQTRPEGQTTSKATDGRSQSRQPEGPWIAEVQATGLAQRTKEVWR